MSARRKKTAFFVLSIFLFEFFFWNEIQQNWICYAVFPYLEGNRDINHFREMEGFIFAFYIYE